MHHDRDSLRAEVGYGYQFNNSTIWSAGQPGFFYHGFQNAQEEI